MKRIVNFRMLYIGIFSGLNRKFIPIRIGKSTVLHIANSENPVMLITPFWVYPSENRM